VNPLNWTLLLTALTVAAAGHRPRRPTRAGAVFAAGMVLMVAGVLAGTIALALGYPFLLLIALPALGAPLILCGAAGINREEAHHPTPRTSPPRHRTGTAP
jgi:peptidoglycan/LPS O-acetylase OafA/YrhL